ncbi:hypothetical protein LCGC14_3093200, partial [marine sediment metagenome]
MSKPTATQMEMALKTLDIHIGMLQDEHGME